MTTMRADWRSWNDSVVVGAHASIVTVGLSAATPLDGPPVRRTTTDGSESLVAVGLRRDDTGTPSSEASRATRLAITSGPSITGPVASANSNASGSVVVAPSVAVTSTVPAAWAGVVTRIAVVVVVMIVAGVPPKSTPMVPARLVPVSSAVVPPVSGPSVGSMPVRVGANTT